jgi:glyoxylase-like metal-dependent hydrolase (beta-lactamase superfamily II)
MLLHRIENDIFHSNCYIIGEENHKSIIIDPGSYNLFHIRQFIKANSLEPEFILLTHEHFDHIFGCHELKHIFKYKIICSKTCALNAANAKKNYSFFYGQTREIKNIDFFVEDLKYSFEFHNLALRFHLTPGHSPGGMCISIDKILFTGDTILKNLKTVMRLPDSEKAKLRESVTFILSNFPKDTYLLPGHGEAFFLKDATREVVLGSEEKNI